MNCRPAASLGAGYWRNYLKPQGLAAIATEGALEQIRRQREAEERARLEEKAKAQVQGGPVRNQRTVGWGQGGLASACNAWATAFLM